MGPRVVVAILIVAAGLAGFFWFKHLRTEKQLMAEQQAMAALEAERHERAERNLRVSPSVATEKIALLGRTPQQIEESRKKYATLQRQISAAQTRAGDNPGDAPTGTLDKDYIKSRIHELVPLMKECYELGRATQPSLAGRMVVEFKISGVPGLGGVVDHASVMRNGPTPDGGIPPNPTLDECITATVESMTFDPPKGGGTVTVHYPMIFSTSDSDGGT